MDFSFPPAVLPAYIHLSLVSSPSHPQAPMRGPPRLVVLLRLKLRIRGTRLNASRALAFKPYQTGVFFFSLILHILPAYAYPNH
ncbi:hypothetical protein HBH50_178010 [Parastagonospora nodorum]|nr:hypothetical protein HBH50_178010 [Parastagonospora nodorum]KAH4084227.1 hypothetical protein HBH48_166480 [Parastagonospora nodorum]